MKKFGSIIGTAIGCVGAGMMMAAGARLEGYLHNKIAAFMQDHEITIIKKKSKKVGPYAVE